MHSRAKSKQDILSESLKDSLKNSENNILYCQFIRNIIHYGIFKDFLDHLFSQPKLLRNRRGVEKAVGVL